MPSWKPGLPYLRSYRPPSAPDPAFMVPTLSSSPALSATPGSVEYLVDEATRQLLQDFFHIPHGRDLSQGRDVREDIGDADCLHVEGTWRVNNQIRKRLYEKFRPPPAGAATAAAAGPPGVLRREFSDGSPATSHPDRRSVFPLSTNLVHACARALQCPWTWANPTLKDTALNSRSLLAG